MSKAVCRACGDELLIGHNQTVSQSKRNRNTCSPCQKSLDAPGKRLRAEMNKEQYARRKRESYLQNRTAILANRAEYKRNNPAKVAEHNARRKARKLQQTPDDACQSSILAFYDMAERLTRINGTPYHVDHIKPLSKGGLHHQDNLVVMRGDWNTKKGTQHWPWLTWFNEPVPANN